MPSPSLRLWRGEALRYEIDVGEAGRIGGHDHLVSLGCSEVVRHHDRQPGRRASDCSRRPSDEIGDDRCQGASSATTRPQEWIGHDRTIGLSGCITDEHRPVRARRDRSRGRRSRRAKRERTRPGRITSCDGSSNRVGPDVDAEGGGHGW